MTGENANRLDDRYNELTVTYWQGITFLSGRKANVDGSEIDNCNEFFVQFLEFSNLAMPKI